MKKLLTLIAMLGIAVSTHAANYAFLPLLTGYNVIVPTNLASAFPSGNGTYAGLGQTNVLFTTYGGQAVFSLTNNAVFGSAGTNTVVGINTNTVAPDAFKPVTLASDANGDVNGTASLFLMVGNTNYEPTTYMNTNASGNVFIGTNAAGVYWPLLQSQFPNWAYPASTNLYPTFITTATNVVTVYLYGGAGPLYSDAGSGGNSVPASFPKMWETAPSFIAQFTVAAGVPTCLTSNLPTVFTTHAKDIYCSITVSNAAGLTASTNELVNMLGILQPRP
jgi:hypothetical protein